MLRETPLLLEPLTSLPLEKERNKSLLFFQEKVLKELPKPREILDKSITIEKVSCEKTSITFLNESYE